MSIRINGSAPSLGARVEASSNGGNSFSSVSITTCGLRPEGQVKDIWKISVWTGVTVESHTAIKFVGVCELS